MEETIKKIFNEIDNAIIESLSDKPKTIDESNFIKKYNRIKEKYL